MPDETNTQDAAAPTANTADSNSAPIRTAPKKAKAARKAAAKSAKAKAAKGSPTLPKAKRTKDKKPRISVSSAEPKAQILSSEIVFQGPLFRVCHDRLIGPGGKPSERDVIRHHGSVVILAIDSSRSKKNPYIVVERQYRHAANQYLWELPAGKLEPGEEPLAGAQRELAEETGYTAKKWKPLVEYFASPGFLGEAMKVFTAEGLVAGAAHPEADEDIEFRLVKLSEVLKMIDKGAIRDGKTLSSVLLYARLKSRK